MTERKNRPLDERLQDAEEKLRKLKAKAAKDTAKANPALSPILEALENTEKLLLAERKGFSTGPQSFEVRKEKHRLWIDEIEAAEDLAQAQVDYLSEVRDYLRNGLNAIIESIANDDSFDIEEAISELFDVEHYPVASEIVEQLEANVILAKNARQDFDALCKMKKSERQALSIDTEETTSSASN